MKIVKYKQDIRKLLGLTNNPDDNMLVNTIVRQARDLETLESENLNNLNEIICSCLERRENV